jgi:hypothetical protein
MLRSHNYNAGQNHNIQIANRSFENVVKFTYLGITAKHQHLVYKAIKSRLNSGNACHHSVQSLVFSFAVQKCKD